MTRILIFILIISHFSVIGQYRVTPIEIGKEITALYSMDDGSLLYGTSRGELGVYDGLLAKRLYTVDGQVHSIKTIDEKILILTSAGAYTLGTSLKPISGSHLDCIESIGSDLLVCTNGIYTYASDTYLPTDIPELSSFINIKKAKSIKAGASSYLLLDYKLFRNNSNRWRLLREGVLDIAPTINSKFVVMDSLGVYEYTNGDTLLYEKIDSKAKLYGADTELILVANNFVSILSKEGVKEIYSLNTDEVTTCTSDAWGNIWLARGTYLYKIKKNGNEQLPKLNLVSINGISNEKKIELQSGQSLQVKYKGVHLGDPHKLQYQVRLSPYSQWSEPTEETEKVYNSLQDGRYDLQVRATTDGINYTYTETIKINVLGAIEWLWYVLFGLGFGILLLGYISLRRWESYKGRMEKERAELLTKNKILSLQQKSMQLQMNPHFIYNALNSVKGLIAKGDAKQARQSITDFAHLMRSTLNQSRNKTTSISDEVTYITRYLELEKWINNSAFDFTVRVSDSVDEGIQIPTMMIQPLVENAVKHAFDDTIMQPHIDVSFDSDDRFVIISVKDNGKGLEGNKEKAHDSVALSLVAERLKLAYPFVVEPLLTIESDVNGTSGVTAQVKIPSK